MKRHALLTAFVLSLVAASACDSDDPCADDSCEVDERDETSEPPPPPPNPIPCRPACDALLGNCGGGDPADPSLLRAIEECIDWCETGGLSGDEAACLESSECAAAQDCMAP